VFGHWNVTVERIETAIDLARKRGEVPQLSCS
jgi:hypothetical protein